MASTPGQPPVLVTVPNLLRLPAQVARDFAHRAQLVAVGPDLDSGPTVSGTVVQQEPLPGAAVPRWSTVVIRTSHGGPGDAGVREPRRPNPPPLSVQLHAEEPPPAPDEPAQAVEQARNIEDGDGATLP